MLLHDALLPGMQLGLPQPAGKEPLRPKVHHEYERDPEDEALRLHDIEIREELAAGRARDAPDAVVDDLGEDPVEAAQERASQHDSPDVADAAEDDHAEHE